MDKSEELQRMERDLSGQPELREKLEANIKRIVDAGEVNVFFLLAEEPEHYHAYASFG